MATILFLTDVDEGHVIPTIGLANSLKREGHRIIYLGISDIKDTIEEFDHTFIPIFKKDYPPGFIIQYKRIQKANWANPKQVYPRPHLQSILEGEFDVLMEELQPDLLIINYDLPIEAFLISRLYHKRFTFFTPWLRPAKFKPSAECEKIYSDLPNVLKQHILKFLNVEPEYVEREFLSLDNIPELIPCPKDFDSLNDEYDTPVYHIEPAIKDRVITTNFIRTLNIPPGRKIIYLSLGSQTILYQEWCKPFYQRFIDLMSRPDIQNWHLVISVGKEFTENDFEGVSSNVSLCNWVPQLEILNKASVVVTHGGLGTVKECIYFGLPMLVFPITKEQTENAERTSHHNLGIKLDYRNILDIDLHMHIKHLMYDISIKRNVDTMKKLFVKYDTLSPSKMAIKQILKGDDER